jgi:hypothetical protein
MAVEMHEPQRALTPGQRTQQRDRYRVIAAERDEVVNLARLFFDLDETALDVAMRYAEIADISEVQPLDLGP